MIAQIAPRYESREQLAIVASYLDRQQTVWHSFVILNARWIAYKNNVFESIVKR
jgi:hypothetical protein